MKKKINFVPSLLLFVILSLPTFSQGPGEPYNPMTADGAKGIWPGHTLHWKNPTSTVYNQIYFSDDSTLVNSLDSSALLYNGYPSSVYSNAPLSLAGWLHYYKKYYWKVVEFDSSSSTIGSTWYFTSRINASVPVEEYFTNGIEEWVLIGPNGLQNWTLSNTSYAEGNPPELQFNWTPNFVGQSYIMLDKYINGNYYFSFNHYVDFYAATFTVGFGITTDSGNNWQPIWEISPTWPIGPETVSDELNTDGIYDDYKVGFYFSGDSYNIDYWYIDDFLVLGVLTPPTPPRYLEAMADTSVLEIFLNWLPGSCPSSFHEIVRKEGLPLDSTNYYLITTLTGNIQSYVDENVFPNKIYTYKVRTYCGSSNIWSNEATAYVPNIVPVELQSFTAEVNGSNVNLIWATATETNNSGFEILRFGQNDHKGWEKIGFVPGFGTTSEVHHYSFVDESLQTGKYQYRLKQIDFDGSFEYSNIVEVTIDAPTKFSLEQNYPNPFNPVTSLQYAIGSRQFVTLKIYDVLGNEIVTLVNEEKAAGTYEVEFNVAQVSRPELASGIYFYQLKAGNFLETKKMLLLK